MDKTDRRQHPRHPFILRVAYKERSDYLVDWTENLSAGGLFVRTEQPFEAGDPVRLSLSFPGLLQRVEVQGVVAWVRKASASQPRGVGIRVDGDADRRRLAELALHAETKRADQPPTRYRVLVAEDNRLLSEMYQQVLTRVGKVLGNSVDVLFTEDGRQALDIAFSDPVDLVITDIYMPVMDGFQLVESLRGDARTCDIPVFVITSGDDNEIQRAKTIGVDAVLKKPVQFVQMLETVVHLLQFQGHMK